MTIKMSLQEAQEIYRRTNKIRREKEYLRSAMQRVKDILEAGPAPGATGEEAVRQCLAVLNDALGVTGDAE